MSQSSKNLTGKRLVILAILFLLSGQLPAATQPRGFGLGVIIGEPTGISFKKWMNTSQALDGAVAWSFGHEDAFHLHLDYLFHNRRLIIIDRNVIPFYYGIGGRFKFGDSNTFGIRFPLGLTVFIVEAPIDLFLEVVPIMNLAPETDLDLNAAIGARYYFH
jgi:hypothetical protein